MDKDKECAHLACTKNGHERIQIDPPAHDKAMPLESSLTMEDLKCIRRFLKVAAFQRAFQTLRKNSLQIGRFRWRDNQGYANFRSASGVDPKLKGRGGKDSFRLRCSLILS